MPRENTKMFPLELVATPATSPNEMSGGIVNGSGTDSNGSSGTAAGAGVCVETGTRAHATNETARINRFMADIVRAQGCSGARGGGIVASLIA